jgi:hypothetical protein
VLDPPRARAAEDAARTELERVAAERGLPISMIPVGLVDGAGNLLPPEALLETAARYGGDQILVGRGADTAGAPLQWSLYTHALNSTWSGPLAAGIDHTVDLLVPQQGSSLAEADAEARVQVDGVTSLAAYAEIERTLQSVPGVRHANIVAADASSITFDVMARGGAAGVTQELTGSTRLVRIGGAGERVVYRYQPHS